MTRRRLPLLRDNRGAAMIELAFGLPVFIMLVWMIYQGGLIYRANSGIQHALGQGARFATLFPMPGLDTVEDKMEEAVYGVGPGDFSFEVDDDKLESDGYLDLTVTYSQETSLLLAPGPQINITKTKRVWVASATGGGGSGTSPGPGAGEEPEPVPPADPEPEPPTEPEPDPVDPTEPEPAKQTCWDGSVILASATCPIQTKTCSGGQVIPVTDTCPAPPPTNNGNGNGNGNGGPKVCDKTKKNPNC